MIVSTSHSKVFRCSDFSLFFTFFFSPFSGFFFLYCSDGRIRSCELIIYHSGRYDQHRSDGDRDRHRGDHKERDWSDRDHKKARHD